VKLTAMQKTTDNPTIAFVTKDFSNALLYCVTPHNKRYPLGLLKDFKWIDDDVLTVRINTIQINRYAEPGSYLELFFYQKGSCFCVMANGECAIEPNQLLQCTDIKIEGYSVNVLPDLNNKRNTRTKGKYRFLTIWE
jgi:hypothetical protein